MAIQFGQIRGSQIKQSTIETGHIKGIISKEKLDLSELTQKDSELLQEINKLKSTVDGKNSNTQVFATFENFQTAVAEPYEAKVGDLAFVVDIKKCYIYQGVVPGAIAEYALPEAPAGWMYFDEISTEVDLAAYAKTSAMEAADTALDEKITALDGKVDAEVTARGQAITEVKGLITSETEARTLADTALEGKITAETEARTQAVSDLQGKITANTDSINEYKTNLSAETGATLIGATFTGVSDKTVQGVFTHLDGKVTTIEGKISSLESAVGESGDIATRLDEIEQKNTEQDSAIDVNKKALHIHKKLIKSIGAEDDKVKVMTPSEFDIPVGVDGLYTDCTHVYVNGILQAEKINFNFVNAEGTVAEAGKAKGVSFDPANLVEGDTVIIEWIEKRFQ